MKKLVDMVNKEAVIGKSVKKYPQALKMVRSFLQQDTNSDPIFFIIFFV